MIRTVCGIVAVGFGLAALLGYFLGIEFLVRPFAGYCGTQPLAAICVALIGLAGLAKPRPGFAVWATLSAACLIVLGVASSYAHTALLPAIAPFASVPHGPAGSALPIAFGPTAAIGLLLICFSQVMAWRCAWTASQIAGCIATAPFAIAVIGFLYGRSAFDGTLTPAAALVAILAAIGTITAKPDRGLLPALLSGSAPGRLARRLLIGASSWALLVGWLLALHADAKSGALLAIEVVFVIAILGAIVTVTTAQSEFSDRIRIAQELELQNTLATLRISERELAQNIDALQTTLEHMSQGILVIDPGGVVTVCNRQAVEMLNLPHSLMASRPSYTEVLAHQDRDGAGDAFFAELHDIVGEPRNTPRTYENRRADGRIIEIRNVPLRDGGVLRTFSDITARRATEEHLRHAQKLTAVGELAAGVAHDFNNILQIVVSNLELVMDEVADGTAAHDFANAALGETQRGALLTGQLLSYARKQMLRPQEVELRPLFADLTRLLATTLGPHIAMKVRLEGNPWVLADPGQLKTALLNLALNAEHAMPNGGTLNLNANPSDIGLSDRGASDDGTSWIEVTVADDGTGMDAATLAKSIDPFFTTKGLQGSGLGLSMVQGFAEQSGGKFSIMSALGLGTTVKLLLPAADAVSKDAVLA